LLEQRNIQVQQGAFGESFARRSGPFVALYDAINGRRLEGALNLAPRSRVLEIGPGNGAILHRLAKRGHSVVGLDLSRAVTTQIETEYGIEVLTERLEDFALGQNANSFDAIIMRHVLEHFTEPFGALRAVANLLKPTGKAYVAVPNMRAWHSLFGGWAGYADYHIQYFNLRSLTLAAERAGLTLAHSETYEPLSAWPNTLLRSARRIGADRQLYAGDPVAPKRLALEALRLSAGLAISPVRWIQGALGRGDELVIIAEASAERNEVRHFFPGTSITRRANKNLRGNPKSSGNPNVRH
jgi:2-polyprenyl-3-methyl-5-hydroxy-6-metoxy-1,4-benzoquinol methylase